MPSLMPRITPKIQAKAIALLEDCFRSTSLRSQLHAKMRDIDQQYARYKESSAQGCVDSTIMLSQIPYAAKIPPITISQCDAMLAYLVEVFLSGVPLFPVVGMGEKRKVADQLESILWNHSTLAGYHRQLQLMLTDAVRYNVSFLATEWKSFEDPQFVSRLLTQGEVGTGVELSYKSLTELTRWDPYNVFFDETVLPADLSRKGDFVGYVERMTKQRLRRFLQELSGENLATNVKEALENTSGISYYTEPPTITSYASAPSKKGQIDWSQYMTKFQQGVGSDVSEVSTLYVRIAPSDLEISAPQPNSVQIWKMVVVNGEVLVHLSKVNTAKNLLPVLVGQPWEDGMGYQTQGVGEQSASFQLAAGVTTEAFYAQLAKALKNPGIYDSEMISSADINSKSPTGQIPARLSSLGTKRLGEAWMPFPVNSEAMALSLQASRQQGEFAQTVLGLNNAQQGRFQKGNKSVTEWEDTMSYADTRPALRALSLESQVFGPLKEILRYNFILYGQDAVVDSQTSGEEIQVVVQQLREASLSFRMADGHTPKSKLLNPMALKELSLMIGQNPVLQQQLQSSILPLFTHLASALGVTNIDSIIQLPQPQQPQQGALPNGIPTDQPAPTL